jgi:hypothetical protein
MSNAGATGLLATGVVAVGIAAALAAPAAAGEADVLRARVVCDAQRVCRFDVTVRHADEGWKHYADRFEVLSPAGEVLGTRVLRHPHVDEQPFTRSLGDVRIPDGVEQVRIGARDSVHEWGGEEIEVEIPTGPEGPDGPG